MLHCVSSSFRNSGRVALLALALLLAGPGAARATVWHTGDLTTYSQAEWGGDPALEAGAALLIDKFDTVYAATFGVTVGSFAGFTPSLTDAPSVLAYIPAIGPVAALNGTVLNPISTSSGAFGGVVLGLEFNVDFSDAGFLPAASGLRFGDLILANFTTGPDVALNGLTVRQFLADANILLGGGSSILSIADAFPIVLELTGSFDNGIPFPFAQEHLVAPLVCPPLSNRCGPNPVPEPSSLLMLVAGLAGLGLFRRRRN